ncbi:hypothetical protein Ddye_009217 [Dipteronia dyeriana]|uniref:RNase H type-1 domain-containing protein n=1 Tax=Dipteronia dyeriana TaxID=168575 RepID=A0AAD9XB85_9ROSI|nr:hypothetical protein Ddye_009217 [Dipteronia dyeriana]
MNDLGDLGYNVPCYTWSNKRDVGLIMEILDRSVCFFDWKQLFPWSHVTNLEFWSSDHMAMLVKATAQKTRNVIKELVDGNGILRDTNEVKKIVFDIFPTKAPGIDGMSALFYQKFWDVVGDTVMTTCLRCLNDGDLVEAVIRTLIMLIPKVPQAKCLKDFRPISLCNVSYKIVAKTLLFARADSKDSKTIRQTLDIYASASGQVANFIKSALCVSKVVSHDVWSWLARIIGADLIWSKLVKGVFKINVNAAINDDAHMVGVGDVVRESSSRVAASMAVTIATCFSPVVAEVVAILKGLRSLLSLVDVHVSFVPRTANKVAHVWPSLPCSL